MKTKKVKWISGERTIPNVGTVCFGDSVLLPEESANDFIKQGNAEPISKAKTTKKNAKGVEK